MNYVYIINEAKYNFESEIYFDLIQAMENFDIHYKSRESIYNNYETTDVVIDIINKASCVICIYQRDNSLLNLELGIAIGLKKKILIIFDYFDYLPDFLGNFILIRRDEIKGKLIDNIKAITKTTEFEGLDLEHNVMDLINRYKHEPDILNSLNSKEFEELIYQYLKYRNYKVEKNDEILLGYDFELVIDGKQYLVEVKKLSSNNKVSLNYIQQFFGIISAKKAYSGIFISNVDYTDTAKKFIQNVSKEVILLTFDEFIEKF